jgi:protein-S-isoprenylcysteine O-methyltransferase Ste14
MSRVFGFVYGLAAYLVFLAVFLWFIGFVGDIVVPKTVNTGVDGNLLAALLTDIGLVALFGIQHSVMARPAFKAWVTAKIPQPMERSTYMWASNITLATLMWQWQPIGTVLWHVEGSARLVLYGVFAFGWGLLLISTFLTDHFELFGLKQIFNHLFSRTPPPMRFKLVLFYKLIRHPMMLGFLIALWAVPTMTAGSLLLALGLSAYILVGIHFEEHDLEESLGADYRDYRERTPMLVPGVGGRGKAVRGITDRAGS